MITLSTAPNRRAAGPTPKEPAFEATVVTTPPQGSRKISLALALLPTSVACLTQGRNVALSFTLGLALLCFAGRRAQAARSRSMATWSLAIPMSLTWFRGNVAVKELVTYLLASYVVTTGIRRLDRRQALYAISDSITVLLTVNIVLYYALGITSTNAGSRVDTLPGDSRVFFPLVSSLNALPDIAAVSLCLCVLCLRFQRFSDSGPARSVWLSRLLRIAPILAPAVVMIAANSRLPIAASLLGLVIILLPGRSALTLSLVALVVAVPLCFSFTYLTENHESLLIRGVSALPSSRQNSVEDALTLNNRIYIWEGTLDAVGTASTSRKLLGYGRDGQAPSGASANYAYIFKNFVGDPTFIGPHNSTLQVELDSGYLGLTFYSVSLLLLLVDALREEDALVRKGLLVIATIVAVTGSTESVGAPSTMQTSFLVLLMATVLCRLSFPKLTSLSINRRGSR